MSSGPFASLNLAAHVGDEAAHVAANRDRAASLVGLGLGDLAVLDAEHGATVRVVTAPGRVAPGDAAVTSEPGIGLVALAADCVPIVLAATDGTPCVGAVHCGWRGLVAGVVPAAVSAMRALGATRLAAALGPSVCAHCYPVPEARIAELGAAVPPNVRDAATALPGSLGVADGVMAWLREVGVDDVHAVPGCTAEETTCFSYRRAAGQPTGRQGMIVRL